MEQNEEDFYSFSIKEWLPDQYLRFKDQIKVDEIALCEDCFDQFLEWHNKNKQRFDDSYIDSSESVGIWLGLFPHSSKRTRVE